MEQRKRKAGLENESPFSAMRSRSSPKRKAVRPSKDDDDQTSFARKQKATFWQLDRKLNQKYASLIDGNHNQKQLSYALALLQRDRRDIKRLFDPESGTVYLSGSNDSCQLGQMTECNSLRQLKNSQPTFKVVQVEAASLANFLLTSSGQLFSFGCGDLGSLGRPLPVSVDDDETKLADIRGPVDDETKVAEIRGFHRSTHATVEVSQSLEDGSVIQVAAGNTHRLVLSSSGSVYSFGCYMDGENQQYREMPPPDVPDNDNEKSNQYVGPAPFGHRESPRHLYEMPKKVNRIYAGGNMSAVRLTDNTIMTWGVESRGELGQDNSEKDCKVFMKLTEAKKRLDDEDLTEKERKDFERQYSTCIDTIKSKFMRPSPVVYDPPIGKHVVLDVACGGCHMLATVSEVGNHRSVVYGSGLNQYGQLGLGHEKTVRKLTMLNDSLDRDISQIAAGAFHSVFLDLKGTSIWTCGRNDYGALGIKDTNKPGDFENRMQSVKFDEEDRDEDLIFSSVSAGEHQTYAVTKTGKLYSWGFGDTGALCHGRDADELRPKVVKEFKSEKCKRILHACGGSQHVIVLTKKNESPTEF